MKRASVIAVLCALGVSCGSDRVATDVHAVVTEVDAGEEQPIDLPDVPVGEPSDVPDWAGDYDRPPPVTVRGRNELSLPSWTWGWTSPPDENGEQESVVADGAPPDPLEVVEYDDEIELRFPLDGWTFEALVRSDADGSSGDLVPVDPVEPGVWRLDARDLADGSWVHVVGSASPGYYELNVSFAVQRSRA